MVSGPFYVRGHQSPASAGFLPWMFPARVEVRAYRQPRPTGSATIYFLLSAGQIFFTRTATILTSAASSHKYVTDALSRLAISLLYR